MRNELRTVVSSFVASFGETLDYAICNRRSGETVTLRQLVDALAEPQTDPETGKLESATEIVNRLGATSNPLTSHVVTMAKELGIKFSGKGRGATQDKIKQGIEKMTAAKLIELRVAALGKVKTTA